MQARPTRPTSHFDALDVSIETISCLRGIVGVVRRYDRDLADQLRRALSSIALNIAEGDGSSGGNRIARFSTALGSTREARAALRVAVAWGYVAAGDVEAGDAMLDRVAAMLHRLGAKR
jgi:four helix bundle protein